APGALLIAPDRSKEIDLPEDRPMRIAEIELAVGTLPEHESRQTHLAAGANDEIGVRAVVRVEVLCDRLGRQSAQDLVGCLPAREAVVEVALDRIDDLRASAIADADVQEQSIVRARGGLRGLQRLLHGGWEKLQLADGADPDPQALRQAAAGPLRQP